MKVRIERGVANGKVYAPPSKSVSHRLMISAALANGKSTIRGVSDCEDVKATVSCLSAIGAKFEKKESDFTVYGTDVKSATPSEPLDCNESGSTLRFILPIASLSNKPVSFVGSRRLMQRPMSVYENIYSDRGLFYHSDEEKLTVRGALSGGEYCVPGNVSSQFVSGLIFALAQAEQESLIKIEPPIESLPYILLTLDAVRKFGITADFIDGNTIKIPPRQTFSPTDVTVEGDYSGAAFTEAFNLLGGNVSVLGLNPESLQGDKIYREHFRMLKDGCPTINIENCPDSAPIYFALAAALNGATFTGTKRLKIKESDRAAAMASELSKLGVRVDLSENSAVIHPTKLKAPSEALLSHNDHRIVMALSVLLTLVGGEIEGAEAVNKSYPDFFSDLARLGIGVFCE